MFSVIIPTMWKCDYIHSILNELILCDLVGEIILIDNSRQYYFHYDSLLPKINLIVPDSNIYVNAAWNLGAKLAKYDQLCLCNDDILFSNEVFSFLNGKLKNVGVVGQSEGNYVNTHDNTKMNISVLINRGYAYGCMMFIHKNNYREIPSSLKILYGDDYLMTNRLNLELNNFNITYKKISETASLAEFDEVRLNDYNEYQKIISSK